jgi:uncharacterized protein YfdQ (DUF2303 family)
MSKYRVEFNNAMRDDKYDINKRIAQNRVSELEQQKEELIDLVVRYCGFKDQKAIDDFLKKYKKES